MALAIEIGLLWTALGGMAAAGYCATRTFPVPMGDGPHMRWGAATATSFLAGIAALLLLVRG